jgi:hypothetical protein
MAWSGLGNSQKVRCFQSEQRPVVLPYLDFRRRFLSLLSYKFREFGSVTALSILEAVNTGLKAVDADPSKSRGAPRVPLTRALY